MQVIEKVLEQGISQLHHDGFFTATYEMHIFTNTTFSQMFSFV